MLINCTKGRSLITHHSIVKQACSAKEFNTPSSVVTVVRLARQAVITACSTTNSQSSFFTHRRQRSWVHDLSVNRFCCSTASFVICPTCGGAEPLRSSRVAAYGGGQGGPPSHLREQLPPTRTSRTQASEGHDSRSFGDKSCLCGICPCVT